MQRTVQETVTADAIEVVRAAAAVGGLPAAGVPASDAVIVSAADGNRVEATARTGLRVPWFWWFFHPPLWVALRRAAGYATARATHAAAPRADVPAPKRPRTFKLLPPAVFTPQQAIVLGALCALVAIATYGSSVVGQTTAFVQESFAVTEQTVANGLAITRIGVLVTLIAAWSADYAGRRRMLLLTIIGVGIANLVAALAPNFVIYIGAQSLVRACVSAALTIAAIVAVEEAPEGARAWTVAMLGLAGGAGYAVGVVLLPLGDIAPWGWRLLYALSALALAAVPIIARELPETRRFAAIAARTRARVAASGGVAREIVRRIREIFELRYIRRFALISSIVFLTSIAATPIAQLTNQYLLDERGFSGFDVTVFRAVTNGVPGIIGVLIAGRLAERVGRRPLAIVGLTATALLNIAFFLGDGWVLWASSTLAIMTAALAGISVGTIDRELFPTEVRGMSTGIITVAGVLGAVFGLVLAGVLEAAFDEFGTALALLSLAPIAAALLLAPFLPESAHRDLDDISPSEI